MYRKVWWLNPIVMYLLLLILAIGAFMFSDNDYIEFFGAQKFINAKYLVLYISSFLIFALGVLFSKNNRIVIRKEKIKQSKFSEEMLSFSSLKKAYKIMYKICIGAYLVWLVNFARIHGLSSLKVLISMSAMSEYMYVFKYNTGQIAGVTSFTEIAMLVIPLGVYLCMNETNKKSRNRYLRQIVSLIIISLIRSILFSERIALLEVLVPLIISFLAFTKEKKIRMLIIFGPVIGGICLVLLFGIMEYYRSWMHYYINVYDSYATFIQNRLLGYYYNAINTECLILEKFNSIGIPYYSLTWVWKLPGMGNLLNALYGGDFQQAYGQLLFTYSNPDYTNCGGLLTFYKDFGYFFCLFQFFFGYVVGRLYKWFIKGGILSIVVYSFVFVGLLELPRYFFFGNTRCLAVYVGILILIICAKRERKLKNV